MNARQRHQYYALKQIQTFLATATIVDPPPGYAGQVNVLRDSIARIEKHASNQASSIRQRSTVRARGARARLRNMYLVPLRQVSLVLRRTIDGMNYVVTVPERRRSQQQLLAMATAALEHTAMYEDQYIAKGMPVDFRVQLQRAIQDVEDASADTATSRAKLAAATAGIPSALRDGTDAVICLGTVIRRAYESDLTDGPAAIAAWEALRRVQAQHASQHASQPTTQPTPVTPPATPSLPAPTPVVTTAVMTAGGAA